MQYYNYDVSSDKYSIDTITESTTALSNRLLGFQFNITKPNSFIRISDVVGNPYTTDKKLQCSCEFKQCVRSCGNHSKFPWVQDCARSSKYDCSNVEACATCKTSGPSGNPHYMGYTNKTNSSKFSSSSIGVDGYVDCVINSTTTSYWSQILWENYWLLPNLYGASTGTKLNQDYSINSCTGGSSQACSLGKRCSPSQLSTLEDTKLSPGWIRGVWTFPISTQSTNEEKVQDTLNYFATNTSGRYLNGTLTQSSSTLTPANPPEPPKLIWDQCGGFISWITDMLANIESPQIGFIRDYMIVKSFASVYCGTLYGFLGDDTTKVLPRAVRNNWQANDSTDFTAVWQGTKLLSTDPGSPYGDMLFNQIKESFGSTAPNQSLLPYHSLLKSMTMLSTQKPFTYEDDIMYLTLPLDAFRMRSLCDGGNFDTTKFVNNIVVPLIGKGMIGSVTIPSSTELLPDFDFDKLQISYTGLTYTDTSIFTKTMQTKTSNYSATPSPLPTIQVKDIDKNVLWPLDTHATINSDGVIVSSTGDKKPCIECFYYITVGIKTWSPGLAFLYLTTEGSPRDPAVYQKIVDDTLLVPKDYIEKLCSRSSTGTVDLKKCKELITQQCTQTYTNTNFHFSPDGYFLLYDGRNSQGICACINSSLVSPSKGSITNNPAAMCFDQNCMLPIPNTSPPITMFELLDYNDSYCAAQCNTLKEILQGEASNIQNLNQTEYNRLCRQSIIMTFNTAFFVQLMIPTIIITSLIPLGFGINKASIIVMVLTLLTLTGISFYLGKLFASRTECDGISTGGKLPICVSSMDPNMELPISFCNINMFCECSIDEQCNMDEGCSCKSGVCVDKSGTRATETVYIKTVNVQMLVLSSSLLILVPILIYLLRRRFVPEMPLILALSIIVLSISIFGTVLYLSLVYEKPRLSYKGICGSTPTPTSKSSDE